MDVTKVYNEYNPKLVRCLPLKDPYFVAELTKQHLFSGTLKEEVLVSLTEADATSRFLCKSIERSLNIDDREPFDRLLLVMEGFNDPSLSKLAREIKQKINGDDSKQSVEVTDSVSSSVMTKTDASEVAKTKEISSSQKHGATKWASHQYYEAGSDIPAVVVDNGSYEIKAGFAEYSEPVACFPSVCGRVINQYKATYVGEKAVANKEILFLKYPIEHGIVTDWDAMEMVWDYTFEELKVAPEEHTVLLTDNPINSKAYREKMAEIMFERFNPSGLFVTNQAVLSLFVNGRTSGIVVQSGGGVTCVFPSAADTHFHHASQTSNLAGCDLTEYLMKLLKKQVSDVSLCNDIKEKLCYVAVGKQTSKSKEYKLPDGRKLLVDKECYQCPEALFKPGLIGKAVPGIHQACYESIMKCDEEVHKPLFDNIVLAGGNSMFPGIAERFTKEITTLAPLNTKINVYDHGRHAAWVGGSIMAHMPTFKRMAVTKAQYEESGPSVIRYSCFDF